MVPLSAQVYKWVQAILTLGVTLLPIQGGEEILIEKSPYATNRNRDKLWHDGPLGSYTDLISCTQSVHSQFMESVSST